eukprot:6469462-Pyramimonas_sp.AAC.1
MVPSLSPTASSPPSTENTAELMEPVETAHRAVGLALLDLEYAMEKEAGSFTCRGKGVRR